MIQLLPLKYKYSSGQSALFLNFIHVFCFVLFSYKFIFGFLYSSNITHMQWGTHFIA